MNYYENRKNYTTNDNGGAHCRLYIGVLQR